MKNNKTIHADSKHAKAHGKKLVETSSAYLNLSEDHKDWYNRREMGKQRGKPKYAPPKVKKPIKVWKHQ